MAYQIAIDIVSGRREALQALREARQGLAALRSDFPTVQGAALGLRDALEGVGDSLLDVARVSSLQGEDLSGIFERIAAGGADGEQALEEFAEVAGRVAPEAAQRLAGELERATAGVVEMGAAAGLADATAEDLAQAWLTTAAATEEGARAAQGAAGAERDEAGAAREATGATQAKGAASDRAAEGTRRHAQASRDQTAALRGARQGLDVVTQAFDRMLPGLQGVLQPLRQVEGALTGVGGAAAGIGLGVTALGALAAATVLAAKGLADDVEKLDNLAAATGASLPNLQVLEELLKRKGIAAGSASFALQNLNREIAQGNPLLAQLGITARDPVEALLQLSRAFSGSSDQAKKTEIATQLLGRGSRELLAILNDLAAVFPGLRAEMEGTRQLMGEDMATAARKFDAEWERAAGRFAGFMNQIKHAAAEAANAVIDSFQETTEQRSQRSFEIQVRQLREEIARLEAVAARMRESGAIKFDVTGAVDAEQKLVRVRQELERLLRSRAPMPGEDDLPLNFRGAEAGIDRVNAALGATDTAAKKAGQSLKEMLQELRAAAGTLEGDDIFALVPPERRGRGGGTLGPTGPVPVPELQLGATGEVEDALAQVREELEALTSSATIAADLMTSFRGGLEDGFGEVFARLIDKTQTWGSAIKKIWESILTSLLSAAGRAIGDIAAEAAAPFIEKAIKFILPFVGAAPAPAAAFAALPAGPSLAFDFAEVEREISAATRVGLPRPSAHSADRTRSLASARGDSAPIVVVNAPEGSRALERQVENLATKVDRLVSRIATNSRANVTISALDSQSFNDYMRSPLGKGLLAQERAGPGGF